MVVPAGIAVGGDTTLDGTSPVCARTGTDATIQLMPTKAQRVVTPVTATALR